MISIAMSESKFQMREETNEDAGAHDLSTRIKTDRIENYGIPLTVICINEELVV